MVHFRSAHGSTPRGVTTGIRGLVIGHQEAQRANGSKRDGGLSVFLIFRPVSCAVQFEKGCGRKADSLKRKFQQIANSKKPTGQWLLRFVARRMFCLMMRP